VFSYAGAGGAGRAGSGVGVVFVCPVCEGFHIALKIISFSVPKDWRDSKAGPKLLAPKNDNYGTFGLPCSCVALGRNLYSVAAVLSNNCDGAILRRSPEMFECAAGGPSSLPHMVIR